MVTNHTYIICDISLHSDRFVSIEILDISNDKLITKVMLQDEFVEYILKFDRKVDIVSVQSSKY